MEILLFIYNFSKLYIAKKIFKHISDSEIGLVFAKKQTM
jgi:hypothetical protein